MKTSIVDRFNNKFIPEPMSGCWLWLDTPNTHGYGRMKVAGRFRLAHRISYEIHKGDIPQDLCVRHNCDNRLCVNPEHLLVGTNSDNVADRVRRGRNHSFNGRRAGAGNPNAKLTIEDVVAIRELRFSGLTLRSIGNRYGVAQRTIRDIFLGRSWAQ